MYYDPDEELYHYGVGHEDGGHSGRFPWGSGDAPYQRNEFLTEVRLLKKKGKTEKEIADHFQIYAKGANGENVPSISRLRIHIRLAEEGDRKKKYAKVQELREKGLTLTQIADELGLAGESSVRSLLNLESKHRMELTQGIVDTLKEEIAKYEKDGEPGMIDVSKGTERQLHVTSERMNAALYQMQLEGYEVYTVGIPQPTNKGQQTIMKAVCSPGTEHKDVYQYEKVHMLDEFQSFDGGKTMESSFRYPASMDSKRIMVRYDDPRDGTIEIRPGVKDLDLGPGTHYAQVRILVDNTDFIKAMAVYGDPKDFPPGIDVIFNSNKKEGTPLKSNPNDPLAKSVLKAIETKDPNNPFGALIKENGGQSEWEDEKGKKHLSLINKRSDEGDWGEWSKKLPSQFLAKQSESLVQKQLKLSIAEREQELEEILANNNPAVKQKLLLDFAEGCDKNAKSLAAASLPGQSYQVILPVISLKDDEVYAPNYKEGSTVALVRFPHEGIYQIPICKVTHKNKEGMTKIGNDALDAVGINKHVADKLSGADFDGDTVMVIPCNSPDSKIRIQTKPLLKDLEGFDNKASYPYKEGMKVLKKGEATGNEMGKISNLITDMTIMGAPEDELARATKHAQVVIDAAKHKLDYQQSYKDNGIQELKDKYQAHIDPNTGRVVHGAATIISRAKAQTSIPKRQGMMHINPETGEAYYNQASDEKLYATYKKVNKKTGEVTEVKKMRMQKSAQMDDTKDAFELVSSLNNVKEVAYAEYANALKALANKARKESLNVGKIEYNPTAKEVYADEVESIKRKVAISELNAPRERRAIRLANAEIEKYKKLCEDDDTPLTKSELKKFSQQALKRARLRVGADGKGTKVELTDREWEAIQNGAFSFSAVKNIVTRMNKEELITRSTPKTITQVITPAKLSRIKAMQASGYPIQKIAESLGFSTSTIRNVIKEGRV